MADPDFAAMARDELTRALTLSWRELSAVVPWGDSFEGLSPAGCEVIVERSYLWHGESGGDILVEVEVYGGPSRRRHGETACAIISSEPQ